MLQRRQHSRQLCPFFGQNIFYVQRFLPDDCFEQYTGFFQFAQGNGERLFVGAGYLPKQAIEAQGALRGQSEDLRLPFSGDQFQQCFGRALLSSIWKDVVGGHLFLTNCAAGQKP